jgi:vacuolar-type H+-ATPase subunit H
MKSQKEENSEFSINKIENLMKKLENEGMDKVQKILKSGEQINENKLKNILQEGNKEFEEKTGRKMTYFEMRMLYG